MEQNQFNPENEMPLFEGQPIEQPEVANEVAPQVEVPEVVAMEEVQPVEQVVEAQNVTQQPEIGQQTDMLAETQVYQGELFAQPAPADDIPLGHELQYTQPLQEEAPFGTPFSTDNTQIVQPMQQAQAPQFTQTNMFVPNAAPMNPKSKKKMITIIVSSVLALVLLSLGGFYGYSVYSKSQALETTKNERNALKKKTDELQTKVTKLETLDKLTDFEACVYGGGYDGVDSGKAFHFKTSGNYEVFEKTEGQFKDLLNKCKGVTEGVKLAGAEEKVEAEIKKLEEAYAKNSQFISEAKAASTQWSEFKAAWKTGLVEEAEFNRIRGLAAAAMGVEPSKLGDRLMYYEIAVAAHARMDAIESKQTRVSNSDLKNYLDENKDDEYHANIKDAYESKERELENMKKDLDKKEKELKDKESKVWNPFQ